MWKLKIAEGGAGLISVNNFIGRQHWEFDPNAGTPEEHAEIERIRNEFSSNRFWKKQSGDLFMRMQLRKEKQCELFVMRDTDEALINTIRRSICFYSSIQSHDGHWPAESAGPLFFVQPLVGGIRLSNFIFSFYTYYYYSFS